MRWIGWGLFIIFFAIVSLISVNVAISFISATRVDTSNPYPEINSMRRTAYLLGKQNWLAFDLEPNSDRLQINTLAALAANYEPGTDVRYSIDYKLTDIDDKTLSSGLYWFKTKDTSQVATAKGQVVPRNFFSEKKYLAGVNQSLYLRTENWPQARHLYVRLNESESDIQEVTANLGQRLPQPKKEIPVVWRRMGEKKRQQVAERNHIYPQFLLTPTEIERILSKDWRPVGPRGVDTIDFRSVHVFSVGDRPQSIKLPRESSEKMYADAGKNLTIPLHRDGRVSLGFDSRESDAISASEDKLVTLNWYSLENGDSEQYSLSIGGPENIWSADLKTGLLEIIATDYLSVTTLIMPDEDSATHPAHYSRPILLTPEQPISYSLHHVSGQATPLRIDVRSLQVDEFGHTDSGASVKAVWRSGQHSLISNYYPDFSASLYDRVSDRRYQGAVSGPGLFYFRAPESVDLVTFTSTSAVLIQVSTRPEKLPLMRSLPGHRRSWLDPENYHNLWFGLRPEEYAKRIAAGATLQVQRQHQPIISDEVVPEYLFDVTQYHPIEKSSLAGRLMISMNDEKRLEQVSSFRRYRQLNQTPEVIELKSETNVYSVSPTLVFQHAKREPFSVAVKIDESTVFDRMIMGAYGEISLPSLNPGKKKLEINSNSGDWFINNAPVGAPGLVEYQSYLLKKSTPLSFLVHKDSEQLKINFQYFVNMLEQRPALIEVEIEQIFNPGDSSGYTLPLRRWFLNPTENGVPSGFVLNKDNFLVDSRAKFVYQLAEDIPTGEHLINVRLISGAPGYIRLTGRKEKLATEVRILREDLHVD